jgi:hypothetical protein
MGEEPGSKRKGGRIGMKGQLLRLPELDAIHGTVDRKSKMLYLQADILLEVMVETSTPYNLYVGPRTHRNILV